MRSSSELWSGFSDPASLYRPGLRWWWPGGAVDPKELESELAEIATAGFGGVEIQPFRLNLPSAEDDDLPGAIDDVHTDRFFEVVGGVISAADRHGLWVDYTLGSAWPYGGTDATTPELSSIELKYASVEVRGPGWTTVPSPEEETSAREKMNASLAGGGDLPPGWAERLEGRKTSVAVVAYEIVDGPPEPVVKAHEGLKAPLLDPFVVEPVVLRAGSAQVLPVDENGVVTVPAGRWRVFGVFAQPTGQRIFAGAGTAPKLVADHFNAAAIRSHLERVGDGLLNVLERTESKWPRAVFTDSLEVRCWLYWADDFLEEFRRRRGYDLLPHLGILKVPGAQVSFTFESAPPFDYDDRQLAAGIRADYWMTVGELVAERCYRTVAEWARERGLLNRVQAHGAPANTFEVYGVADIPETENLFAGGIDYLYENVVGANYDFYKLAASAARIHGRQITSAEAFAHFGDDYCMTIEQIKREADQFLTAGISQIIYHGYPYKRAGDSGSPGWHPFGGRARFSDHFNGSNPIWKHLRPLNDYIARLQYVVRETTDAARIAVLRTDLFSTTEYRRPPLNEALFDAGYDFVHFDQSVLALSKVVDAQLVAPSGAAFDVLLIPPDAEVAPDVEATLSAMAVEGLPVIDSRSSSTSAVSTPFVLVDELDGVVDVVRRLVAPNLPLMSRPKEVYFAERLAGPDRVILVRNFDDQPVELVIDAARFDGSIEQWDPWSGGRRPLTLTQDDFAPRLNLRLAGLGSAVLVVRSDGDPLVASDAVGAVPGEILQIPGPWTVDASRSWAGGGSAVVDRLAPLSDLPAFCQVGGDIEYRVEFDLEGSVKPLSAELQLGECIGVATVALNGEPLGSRYLSPYVFEIGDELRAGRNELVVTVTVPLANHMRARQREQPGDQGALRADSSPVPLGLIGPVELLAMTEERGTPIQERHVARNPLRRGRGR